MIGQAKNMKFQDPKNKFQINSKIQYPIGKLNVNNWLLFGTWNLLIAIFLLLPKEPASAAMLYTGSANQVVYLGETFVVEWYLDSQGKSINSMDLNMTFSADKLEVVEVNEGNSVIDLWVKTPTHDNNSGKIKLVGGVSGGVNEDKLNIFRATFRPKDIGKAIISLEKNSDVLLADGQGTSAGLVFNEVSFTINPLEAKPAQISSSTHPDQDAWYKNQNATLKIGPKEGELYSYSFSSNLEIFPDDNLDDVTQPIHFQNLQDGIYYFKLNSKTGTGNWQEAGVYRVKIDTTPPREFTPSIGQDQSVFEGQPFISYSTTDSVSGIDHYEVKSNFFSGWQKTDDSYFKLPGLVLGDTVEVKVVDSAGNERIAEVKVDKSISNSVLSNLKFWGIMILSLAILGLLVWYYFKLLKKYKVNDK
jgi:hypothetical protein